MWMKYGYGKGPWRSKRLGSFSPSPSVTNDEVFMWEGER